MAVKASELGDIFKDKKYNLITGLSISARHIFMPRNEIEDNPKYRQIIPYCIIRHGDNYMMFERLKKQSETRLHSKLSLGAGGHINEEDGTVIKGLHRELNEEISIKYSEPKFIGIINDESLEVSKCHLGLLFEVIAEDAAFSVNEKDKMTAMWVNKSELGNYRDRFESWSLIVLEFLQ